jgi:hypothetical protein
MPRKTYVYQLKVIYPEGSLEPGWRPACWSDPEYLAGLSRKARRELRNATFRWPRVRLLLSGSSAWKKAALLTWYGAHVTVLRSEPVVWDENGPDLWNEELTEESLGASPVNGNALELVARLQVFLLK